MVRIPLLLGLAVTLTAGAPGPALPASPLTAEQKATHLLNRLAFGPRPGQVFQLAQGGDAAMQDWLQKQLNPKPEPDLDARLRRDYPVLGMSIQEALLAYPRPEALAKANGLTKDDPAYKERLGALVSQDKRPVRMEEELAEQKLVRAVQSEDQLQEVLVDFWFNHFNVDTGKGEDRWYTAAYERDAIRPKVFGRFRDLLESVAWHPAMLFYLDNWLSVKDGLEQGPNANKRKAGLNENYARELMELHTLGVDGGYSQQDVREVARCFTGWTIEKPQLEGSAAFRPRTHDEAPKTVLGRDIRTGGREDGELVLDLLARSPVTARHLSYLLCRRFVSDQPPKALVERVAQAYLKSDGDLKQVYAALFSSPEFWAAEAYQAKVKTPFEFAVSSVRALDGKLEDPLPLARLLGRMGEPLYRCQPPTGYKDTAEAWVNTGALVERLRFGLGLAAGRARGLSWDPAMLPPSDLRSPGTAVDTIAPRILQRPLSAATKEALLKELDAEPQTYPDGEARPVDRTRLVGLVLGSPEFQRR